MLAQALKEAQKASEESSASAAAKTANADTESTLVESGDTESELIDSEKLERYLPISQGSCLLC